MTRAAPFVRLAWPAGRFAQLRYLDPATGREVKRSAGTSDPELAEAKRAEIEARITLGLSVGRREITGGPGMDWDDFREAYGAYLRAELREGSADDAESRLNLAERIINPRTLGDMANRDALIRLRDALRLGKGRPAPANGKPAPLKPRSPHTVRSNFASILAALRWAEGEGWLPAGVPRINRQRIEKRKAMKGRPITAEEFERMLEAVPKVVKDARRQREIEFLMRGLWTSALRLEECLSVHWTDPAEIRPRWDAGRFAVLSIPAARQKNNTTEDIPLLPAFEALLRSVHPHKRSGFVFAIRSDGTRSNGRLRPQTVGKIISDIGAKAGIVVDAASGKFASAHDLRRSCGQNLMDAGADPLILQRIMRHASFETTRRHYTPGRVQREARELHRLLSVTGNQVTLETEESPVN